MGADGRYQYQGVDVLHPLYPTGYDRTQSGPYNQYRLRGRQLAVSGGNVYVATKAFVKQFSHNLRIDVLGTAVRVTNIEPGLAETEFSIIRLNGDEEQATKIYEGTKPLTGEDIANIAFWAVMQPAHVNINRIGVMPVCQSCGPFNIHRDTVKRE
jgi:3-hydroxy acid dehydrogenase/malonic semialdehyde reductase